MADTKKKSVFADLIKGQGAELYIITGKLRNRHKFRHLPASEKYHQYKAMTLKELREHFPGINTLAHHLMFDQEVYDQAVIGEVDDEGHVKTGNREHAKLILREYRQFDHNAKMHSLSKELDENEEIDFEKAKWQPSPSKGNK